MTLPVSGAISFNNINVELGVAGTTQASLGQSSYRTLAGVASGAISMSNFYGKSNRVSISYTFSASTANASLNLSAIGGYSAGTSDITVTINAGVYLYSTSTGGYGLNLSGATTGDTVTIVNNGYIMGQGGSGAAPTSYNNAGSPSAGGPALNLGIGVNPTITNTSGYILGGGGGGGGGNYYGGGNGGGGGGAGGGSGGNAQGYGGGGGGGIGSSGASGQSHNGSTFAGGGGGGRVVLGSGGGVSQPGGGGGGGSGGGGGTGIESAKSGYNTGAGGGGGGWGASGGSGQAGYNAGIGGAGGSAGSAGGNGSGTQANGFASGGASGGKGVNLNGRSITWTGGSSSSGRVYGAVS